MFADAAWSEIRVGRAQIVVSNRDPVAVIRRAGADDVSVSWPDLDVGLRSVSTTVIGASTGAWVFYRPEESEDAALPSGEPAAVHIAPDGELTRFPGLSAHHLLGATAHGLWLTGRELPDVRDDHAWRETQEVSLLDPGGQVREITVEGRTAFALEVDGLARLILYAGAPEARRERWGGSAHVYRYVPVSIGTEVPDRVQAPEKVEAFSDDELVLVMNAAMPHPPDLPPTHLPVAWNLVRLTDADKDSAVASVLREFDHLADYWHGQDGSTTPLSRGLAHPLVEVKGEWPDTRIDVSFTHPLYPGGRLRRSLRVYDDAGRVRPAMYASIHLMEDLDTKALPATEHARDGILDI